MTSIKKLPKLYKNEKININNNRKVCYIEKNNTNIHNNNRKIINDIFNGIKKPYNIKVYLQTKDLSKETFLVAKNEEFIITIEKEKIPIDSIIKIERTSKK